MAPTHPKPETRIILDPSNDLADWPAATIEARPWSQKLRSGSKEDRMLASVDVSVPPRIAEIEIAIGGHLASDIEAAMAEIVSLDQSHGADLGPLGTMLLRTESVASSKIERVQADIDDYARALHGSKANASASSMVAATIALAAMVDTMAPNEAIDLDCMTRAHRALMGDDPYEHDQAGRLRTVQNWIGGSDHSPRGAMYVPPPPELVGDLMADLVIFANRTDLPALAQAAIAHAQFETIHPFTDGNGRIGRALVNTVLRRRGATTTVVVPLASSLVARRDRYFSNLNAYREGKAAPIISGFATAARIAATESRVTAARLASAPEEMLEMVGRVRRGSATQRVLDMLSASPILTVDDAARTTGSPTSSVYSAFDRLESAGVLRPLTNRKRGQVWGATPILDEIEDLGVRIEVASR